MGNAGQFKPKKLNINRIFVIIPAAGLGTRMESDINKQVMEIDGVPVIERTLEAFSKFSSELASMGIALRAVIVTSPDLVYRMTSICKQRRFDFVLNIVTGGDSRMESVWNGIEAISELPFPPMDNDIVFIHDGARCLVDQPTLERCLEGGLQYDICAAAVPVKSTIKQTKHEEPAPEEKPAKAEKAEAKPEEPAKPKSALGLDLSKYPILSSKFSIKDRAMASLKSEGKIEDKEEPKKEEPKVEPPKVEEPKVEEPKAEEPKPEAPKKRPGKQTIDQYLASTRQKEVKPINNKVPDYSGIPLASGGVPIFKAAAAPVVVPDEPEVQEEAEAPAPTRAGSRPAASRRPAASVKKAPEVLNTPDRKELMEVQTPQVFRFGKLVDSYVNGIKRNLNATDDTSLAEALNFKVHLVEGSYSNIKITTKEDIDYAELLLRRQGSEG